MGEVCDLLHIKDWEVEQASPVNDIIWTEMNKGRARPLIIRLLLSLLPLLISATVVFAIVFFDRFLNETSYYSVAAKYLLSSALVIFSFYILPALIFAIVKAEQHERVSVREDTLTSMTVVMMLFNLLILPFGASTILSVMDSKDHLA